MIKYIKLVLLLLFITIPFVSIGYSALQTTLNISGDFVMLGPPTLYNVFANEGRIGTYAREYTDSHMDSFLGVGTEKIYHWYAPYGTVGNNNSSIILNKHNVIFADHCWQMIRTTDTGGVKMIYNGEVEYISMNKQIAKIVDGRLLAVGEGEVEIVIQLKDFPSIKKTITIQIGSFEQ